MIEKYVLMLFMSLFFMIIIHAKSEVSTNNQHKMAFVFLSIAIFIVYFTLLLVYIFRYAIFRNSATKEKKNQTHFSNANSMKHDHNQYFAINRFLSRLKTDVVR